MSSDKPTPPLAPAPVDVEVQKRIEETARQAWEGGHVNGWDDLAWLLREAYRSGLVAGHKARDAAPRPPAETGTKGGG